MKIKNLCFGYRVAPEWLISMTVGILILISATCIFAQDWPQWRGTNRDAKVTGFVMSEKLPMELTQAWKITVGTGDATPALVGDKLYVFARQADNEITLCLNASDGKELWRNQYTAPAVSGAASRHPGPRSSPAVINGKIVTIGVSGTLSCLDTADGKVLWRKDPFPGIVPKFFTSTSPMIIDGVCIAHLGVAGNGAIIAYDLNTGNEKWRWAGEGPEYSSPVLLVIDNMKQIVAMAEKSIVGIGAIDGKLLWQIPFVPQGRSYNAATPIVDGQNVIFTGASRGTSAVKIEKQGDGFVTKELWSNKDVSVQFNTPVLKDGLLFGLTDKDFLFCINANTGQTAWIDTVKRGNGGFAAILDAGSVILALSSNSELTVYKPGDKEYAELARIKVADTPTYAYPVIAGNKIYVRDGDALAMWTIK
jgi:outer membrane protein assembly factor BamB